MLGRGLHSPSAFLVRTAIVTTYAHTYNGEFLQFQVQVVFCVLCFVFFCKG